MLLYLAATNRVISLVIVVERKEEAKPHICYLRTAVSKAPLSTIFLNNADATDISSQIGQKIANLEPEPETWVMHFDGSKQHQGSGAGVTLKSPTGEVQYVLQIHFEATNNMVEYEALLHGLRIAKEIGISTSYAAEIPTWWHNK
ncbi:hypothetical protein QYE76_047831 [Lolium multiflorum]|uniref:RNase H type-1 domain-containing protein n=1 Tax=Lolium multiflorum TaxID=4521 RepID=A0AAD8TSA3_LOLMU|nr:hypothetical protein QYE76_047831 [Lolium multiflorum]